MKKEIKYLIVLALVLFGVFVYLQKENFSTLGDVLLAVIIAPIVLFFVLVIGSFVVYSMETKRPIY